MSEDLGKARHCLWCGSELPSDIHRGRRYCNNGKCCREAADRRDRQARGIDPNKPKRKYDRLHARGAVAGVMSFAGIGAALGLSHECVRAIYLSAITKLRAEPKTLQLLATAADLQDAREERLRELAQSSKPARVVSP